MLSDELLAEKISSFLPKLDERLGRLYLASEAKILGRGGKQKIAKLAKVSRTRIDKGFLELASPDLSIPAFNIRKSGGGRKKKQAENQDLLKELERIVNPYTRGDPMNPLLWTSKSLRLIGKALNAKGFKISYVTVGEL